MGGALDLDERLGTTLTNVSGLDASFFATSTAATMAAMAVIGVVCLVGAGWSLRRGLR